MIDFLEHNPRSCNFVNPLNVKDPVYARDYRRMVRACSFPAGFQNGIYHMIVGIVLCIAVISGLVGGRTTSTLALILLAVGFAAGIVIAVLYWRYMQARIVFPRGGCMVPDNGPTKLINWMVPLVFFVGFGVYINVVGGTSVLAVTIGCVCAVVALVPYIKTNRSSLLIVSFLVLAVPILLQAIRFFNGASDYQEAVTTLSYEGIVFVIAGTLLTQRATAISPGGHDRAGLKERLASDDRRLRFIAAAFACTSIDPLLLSDILRCCEDDDRTVAYTAQIALANTWGPQPKGAYRPTEVEFHDDIPSDFQQLYHDQAQQGRQAVSDRWRRHYALVEQTIREMDEEGDEAIECLFDMATGRGVRYEDARILALEMLGSLRSPRAYATLMETLQHKTRHLADAAAVGFFGADSKAIPYLEKFFAGTRAWIRKRAIGAARMMLDYLEMFDDGEAQLAYALLEPSAETLFDSDDTCTFAATIQLLPCSTAEDEAILRAYYANLRPVIRLEALYSLVRSRVEGAAELALAATHDASAAVRYAAILCLEKLHVPERLETFRYMTKDGNSRVAERANQAFSRANVEMHPSYTIF